jgi:hypothetical protein
MRAARRESLVRRSRKIETWLVAPSHPRFARYVSHL